jgi:general secretion pathway protein J
MVAVAILAIVSTMVWSSFKQTAFTKRTVEAQAARYRTVRIALDRMARELAMAYLSQNEDTAQPERRTRFVGKRHGKIDELTFSYFGHQRLYEDAQEGDTAVISYTQMSDKEHRGTIDLMRRETRRLGYFKPEDLAGQRDILCDDIVGLRVDYYDARDKTWREEWNTTVADGQPDRLPSKIKITLTVHDERGREIPFQTQTRVMLQEPLNLKAVDIATTPAAANPDGGAPRAITPVTSPTIPAATPVTH